MALDNMAAGIRTVLLESGGLTERPDVHALNDSEIIGHPMSSFVGRHRVLGGAAYRWGGRCGVLDDIDYEVRDWIPYSGWPITRDDLEPFYARAKRTSNFDDDWLTLEEIANTQPFDIAKLATGYVDPFVWYFMSRDLEPNFKTHTSLGYQGRLDWGSAYRDKLRLSYNTTVVLNANAYQLTPSSDGAWVRSIEFGSLKGQRGRVKAKAFILAGGGIDNVRLLLNAPSSLRKRYNSHDQLGRYFAQHPRGKIATISADRRTANRLQNTYNDFFGSPRRRVSYQNGFSLSAKAQREHNLLNASAAIYYFDRDDSAWMAGKRLRDAIKLDGKSSDIMPSAIRLAVGFPTIVPNVIRKYITSQPLHFRNPYIEIVADVEQAPDPESRVTLSEEKDVFGLPKARIDWRITEKERDTLRFFAEALKVELENLELGVVSPEPWLYGTDPIREEELWGTYHFIGATRMSQSAENGVVDATGRAHSVENLYLAGANVFPTGGHINPTLTIVALALRTCDCARQRLVNS